MGYETVIGLEVHAELSTKTKIFCNCSTEFGAPPNTHTCPVCLGHPGVLPVANKQAIEFAIKASLALNCEINKETKFDRKNYFYPDLPKAYQISQFDKPVGKNGWIDIEVNGENKRIRINRLHLEEDAGKLTHSEYGDGSLVDFNRVGVPLIEIVSEADMSSPEEARTYLEKIKAIIQYTGVSDVKMEEGSLRCDANISLRPIGQMELGTKRELKNMNTFKGVQKALEYEEERQAEVLDSGEKIIQETLRWNDEKGISISMRSKEQAHDYRYFPDPDLVDMVIDQEWIDRIKENLPELPYERKVRYIKNYDLSDYDADVLTSSKDIADFFEKSIEFTTDFKAVANWIMGDLMRYLNTDSIDVKDCKVTPNALGEMVELINVGTISGKIAKTVFKEMVETGKEPHIIIKEQGLVQISDEGELGKIVEQVMVNNPQSVEDFRNGKQQAIGFLVGQVMKETKGKANPQLVNDIIKEKIN